MIHRRKEGEARRYGLNWDLTSKDFQFSIFFPFWLVTKDHEVFETRDKHYDCQLTKTFTWNFRYRREGYCEDLIRWYVRWGVFDRCTESFSARRTLEQLQDVRERPSA